MYSFNVNNRLTPSKECIFRISGFDPYAMLIVDLTHKFELGVWKAFFSHLIHILYAAGPSGCLVLELDKRYFSLFYPLRRILNKKLQILPDSNFWY